LGFIAVDRGGRLRRGRRRASSRWAHLTRACRLLLSPPSPSSPSLFFFFFFLLLLA